MGFRVKLSYSPRELGSCLAILTKVQGFGLGLRLRYNNNETPLFNVSSLPATEFRVWVLGRVPLTGYIGPLHRGGGRSG